LTTEIVDTEENKRKSLIKHLFDDKMLKKLFVHATRVDIADNNLKAEIVAYLLSDGFIELGTGTNRIAFLRNNYVYKVALDRNGFVDNWTEYKRSIESPEYLTKVYECNMLIAVCEYVSVMDLSQFMDNEAPIKEILSILSESYVMDDVGFTDKNYYNWGYRDNGDIVLLDYGYMYPRAGQERALSCPKCGSMLAYNMDYTKFICSNKGCGLDLRVMDVRRRMSLRLENLEDQLISKLNNLDAPTFNEFKIS
jgi:uncharacterized C2H2 Zn-finger protein